MHGRWKYDTAEREIIRIASDIDKLGYGIMENYLSSEELAPLRAFAETKVREAGGDYVEFVGAEPLRGTLLSELPGSLEFGKLCRRVYELGTGEIAPEVNFYQKLRCLQGSAGHRHSNRFHYDFMS